MTSQVNPNNIDGTYPVAGQDNDSQGFRDNFTNIRNNLVYVKAEVEDLQNKVVLKSALSNTVLDNDFSGNTISNPSFSAWRENYNNIGSASGSVTVNFANGNFQKITMSGATTLAFSFPSNTSNQYASIKLWVNNTNASYTLTLPASCTLGDPDSIAGLAGTSPPIITFSAAEIANNTDYLFEFFTVDGGTTIGIKDLVRNRDIDLSGMSITGNLSLDNISATGNVVTTNGIFWYGNGLPFAPSGTTGSFTSVSASLTGIFVGNLVAAATTVSTSTTTGSFVARGGAGIAGIAIVGGNLVAAATTVSTSTTTGALVVRGGVAVASNITIGGNLVTTGGIINTGFLPLTVLNDREVVANVAYNTFVVDTASSATIANLWITVPTTAVNGTEIVISTLAPLTSCNVRALNGTSVKWVPTGFASAGNVAIKLVYSTASVAWLKTA